MVELGLEPGSDLKACALCDRHAFADRLLAMGSAGVYGEGFGAHVPALRLPG